jgi:hypothetical protein
MNINTGTPSLPAMESEGAVIWNRLRDIQPYISPEKQIPSQLFCYVSCKGLEMLYNPAQKHSSNDMLSPT